MKITSMISKANKGDVKELTSFVEEIGSILECLDSEDIKKLIKSNQSVCNQLNSAIRVADEYDQDFVMIKDII